MSDSQVGTFLFSLCIFKKQGQRRWYSDSLRAGRSEDRISVRASFSAPVQTGPGAHPRSWARENGYLSRGYSGRGVALNPLPSSAKVKDGEQQHFCCTLWDLTVCYRVTFTFYLCVKDSINLQWYKLKHTAVWVVRIKISEEKTASFFKKLKEGSNIHRFTCALPQTVLNKYITWPPAKEVVMNVAVSLRLQPVSLYSLSLTSGNGI